MQFRNPQKLVVCGHQSTVTQAGWKVSVAPVPSWSQDGHRYRPDSARGPGSGSGDGGLAELLHGEPHGVPRHPSHLGGGGHHRSWLDLGDLCQEWSSSGIMYFQMIIPPPCFISDKFRQHPADHDQLAGRVRQAAQLQDVWCQHSVQVKIMVLTFFAPICQIL